MDTFDERGEKVCFNQFSIFIVGHGGFGGPKTSDAAKVSIDFNREINEQNAIGTGDDFRQYVPHDAAGFCLDWKVVAPGFDGCCVICCLPNCAETKLPAIFSGNSGLFNSIAVLYVPVFRTNFVYFICLIAYSGRFSKLTSSKCVDQLREANKNLKIFFWSAVPRSRLPICGKKVKWYPNFISASWSATIRNSCSRQNSEREDKGRSGCTLQTMWRLEPTPCGPELCSSCRSVLFYVKNCRRQLLKRLLFIGPPVFNCSQTKFVAVILVLSVFFMRFFAWPIFRLTILTFSPQKRD